MTKILHILQSFGVGGMENRVARLAAGLSRKGFQITILTLRETKGRMPALPENVQVVHFGVPSGLHFFRLTALAGFIRKNGYHIVHTHNWSTMFYGILAGKLGRCPIVIHGEHGLNFHDLAGIPWKRETAQRALALMCDHIVAVHPYMAKTVAEIWRVPFEKVTPIVNGVDTVRFEPGPTSKNMEFTVGTVGRLDAVKNFRGLLQGFAIFRARHPEGFPARLVLVGEGPEKADLEKYAVELGLGESIRFIGDATDPERWYRSFSVFVNASFSEGMSNTILEAMACGLPLVVSNVPGNASWIKDEVNSLQFNPTDPEGLADKLDALSADPERGRKMGDSNRRRVELEFDNRLFLEKYESLYHSLLVRWGA